MNLQEIENKLAEMRQPGYYGCWCAGYLRKALEEQKKRLLMKHNSHLTAIARKTLPVPTRWLMQNGLTVGRVLDYGCGKCDSVNPADWDNYDPHYKPEGIFGKYDTIICNYVLCTLPARERMDVLRDIQSHLTKEGVAYVSVRNDRPKNGWGFSSRGTYQGRVRKLPLPVLRNVTQYRIYLLTTETQLV